MRGELEKVSLNFFLRCNMVQWCPKMHIIRCILNLKVSHKSKISVSHLVVTFGLAFVFSFSFRLGLGLPFMSPWREELGGHFMTFILHISCQKSRQSLWEAKEHFVTLIEIGMPPVVYISGHKSPSSVMLMKSYRWLWMVSVHRVVDRNLTAFLM